MKPRQGLSDMLFHPLRDSQLHRPIAISLQPQLIIADELTSALDVVVQRHVMQTLRKVQAELAMLKGGVIILHATSRMTRNDPDGMPARVSFG